MIKCVSANIGNSNNSYKMFKFFFLWGGGERAIIVSTKALYFSSFGNEFIYSRIVILYRLWNLRQCFTCTIILQCSVFCRISKKVFVHHIVTLFLWKCRIICSKVMCWKYLKFNTYNDKMMTIYSEVFRIFNYAQTVG